MSSALRSKDKDIIGSLAAMKRAARSAMKVAKETGTPFVVWHDGKIVDLNPQKENRRKKAN